MSIFYSEIYFDCIYFNVFGKILTMKGRHKFPNLKYMLGSDSRHLNLVYLKRFEYKLEGRPHISRSLSIYYIS